MEMMDTYDRRIWRWWVANDIISKSHDTIRIKSQEDDSEFAFCATVNKELLCFYSPYYNAAIKGGFSERHKDLFTLELSASQTRLFVEWLHTGRCERVSPFPSDDTDITALYVFADQTDIIALRRSIMNQMQSFCRRLATPKVMARLVSQLPECSGLRRFLLEEAIAERMSLIRRGKVAVWDWKEQGYNPEDFPKDFYAQLLNGHLQNGGKGFNYARFGNPCDYHEHENGQEWRMTCGRKFISRGERKPQLAYLRNPSPEDINEAKRNWYGPPY